MERQRRTITEWGTESGQARKQRFKEANNAHAQFHRDNGYKDCSEKDLKYRCDTDSKTMKKKHLQWLLDNEADQAEIEEAEKAVEEALPLGARMKGENQHARYNRYTGRRYGKGVWSRHG